MSDARNARDDDLLLRVAEMTAMGLERFCAACNLRYANERDHLARCCRPAAMRIASTVEPRPALSPYGFGEKHGWVGLGTVDVVFRWPDRPAIFVELKCGAGTRILSACVWDAVKLATAVLGGNAGAGYLLAGAPTTSWASRIPG